LEDSEDACLNERPHKPSPTEHDHELKLQAAQEEILHLQELLKASDHRSNILCRQLREVGAIPGMIETSLMHEGLPTVSEEDSEEQEDAVEAGTDDLKEERRRQRREIIDANLKGTFARWHPEGEEEIARRIDFQTKRADAWELESKKTMHSKRRWTKHRWRKRKSA